MSRLNSHFEYTTKQTWDRVEIDAETLTEAVTLFLQGQFPDGEAERCCEIIESFSVARVGELRTR